MESPHVDPGALSVAIALAAGMLVQAIARHLRIPGIVLLLATGVVLGPDLLGWIDPDALGSGLDLIVGFAVSIVLFEGALNLDVKELRRQAISIRGLVTVGALITAAGGALTAVWLLDWEWRLAVLFGALMIVTGPTVIGPLVRRIRLRHQVATVLEGEGVFGDAIGAIVAVLALEVVRSPSAGSLGESGLDLVARLGGGSAIGVAVGLLLALLLRFETLIPDGLENVLALSFVLVTFQAANAVLPESGVVAVIAAGTTLANFRLPFVAELREFKEQLTVLMLGLLFVLLAADVRLSSIADLGWSGLAVAAVLMFVVRPLNVLASTAGSDLGGRDKAFIAWLAPRGIVAAAIASLFAQSLESSGIEGGDELRAMVFLVIAVTVTFLGLTSGTMARRLGLQRPQNSGYIVAGGNPIGLALAEALHRGGESVVVVDSNPDACHAAEELGLRAVWGSALSDGVLARARMEGRAGAIGVTTNDEINYSFARRCRMEYRLPRVWLLLDRATRLISEAMLEEIDARVMSGGARNLTRWAHLLRSPAALVERWRCGPSTDGPEPIELGESILALAIERNGELSPIDERTRFEPDDLVSLVIAPERGDEALASLEGFGWRPERDALPPSD